MASVEPHASPGPLSRSGEPYCSPRAPESQQAIPCPVPGSVLGDWRPGKGRQGGPHRKRGESITADLRNCCRTVGSGTGGDYGTR